MRRVASLLKVQPEEIELAVLMGTLFMCLQAGQGMGDNAASALFYLRFGVDFLPYMYVLLGAATLALTLGYAAGLGRIEHSRFQRSLVAGMVVLLLVERATLLRPFPALYPILWLTINCMGMIIGTFSWNVAGEVSDARQAKRLFPLFASAGILGSVLGNTLTGSLARSLGTENLLLFQALLLGACYFVTLRIGRRHVRNPTVKTASAGWMADLRSGYDFVRGSRLMRLMAYAAVLFSIMFFSIAFPFSKVVTASFPNEASVAGFLGLFTGITTAITFLVSLLLANRLYTRLGVVNSVLLLPLTYAIGFGVFAAEYSLTGGIFARFSQLVVLTGIASTAYSALFNVVPAQRRGQVLAFENGVPSQIGVALSGLLLLLGNRLLSTSEVLLMGLAVTAGCGLLVWRMRDAYGQALVEALRAGRLEVFSSENTGFAGLQGDAGALQVALRGLRDEKQTTRRLAAEILGRMGNRQAIPDLRQHIGDSDAGVRAAIVGALGELGAVAARDDVRGALTDPDAEVRLRALAALGQVDGDDSSALGPRLQMMLTDAALDVRKEALVTLARLGNDSVAAPELRSWLQSADPRLRGAGLEIFGRVAGFCQGGVDRTPVMQALRDPSMTIRVAACKGLAGVVEPDVIEALAGSLHDGQSVVRSAAAGSLRRAGPAAHQNALRVVESGDEAACDAALEAITPGDEETSSRLRDFARKEIPGLRELGQQIASLPKSGRAVQLLRAGLEQKLGRGYVRLIKVVGLIGQPEAMSWIQKAIRGSDSQTRAAALEALETLGDPSLSRAIAALLEEQPAGGAALEALKDIMRRPDRWSRALAIGAAEELGLKELRPQVEELLSDGDDLVRSTAAEALADSHEVMPVNTLKTVSTLERVLLLRDVPLFSELSAEDLERVAEIAREEWFPAGTPICHEGDEGSLMYVIVDGHLHVIRMANGQERILAERGRGDFVGEMTIIESAPRSATLMTQGEVRVLAIDGETFKEILKERSEVSLAMLRSFSHRLRDMSA